LKSAIFTTFVPHALDLGSGHRPMTQAYRRVSLIYLHTKFRSSLKTFCGRTDWRTDERTQTSSIRSTPPDSDESPNNDDINNNKEACRPVFMVLSYGIYHCKTFQLVHLTNSNSVSTVKYSLSVQGSKQAN